MALVVESTSSANAVSTDTLTITKPTGLAVGDLLVSTIGAAASGGATVNLAAGWTSHILETGGAGSGGGIRVQYKIADSADVAAPNFSFTSTFAVALLNGTLFRISGHQPATPAGVSESDVSNSATGRTTVAFTAASTPAYDGALVIMAVVTSEGNSTGTMGTYASTPTLTWTETADATVNSGTLDPIIGIAYAQQTTAAEITAYSSVTSFAKEDWVGVLATYYPTIDATGTNALLSVSPTTFTQAGRADTNANADFLQVSPTIPTQSGNATTPTVWTNETNPSTTWNNETL